MLLIIYNERCILNILSSFCVPLRRKIFCKYTKIHGQLITKKIRRWFTDLPLITDSVSTKSTTAAKRSVPTDAPMLNYIFDAHSTLNKHQHHHDHRWGPHFEGESKNMTVQAGGSAILDCRISLLQDKTVSVIPFVSLSTLICSKLSGKYPSLLFLFSAKFWYVSLYQN